MPLLAKSKDVENNISARTLEEHIEDCLVVFEFLKNAFPAASSISGLGDKFWDILKTSIIFHDLGKAHQEFQKLLDAKPNNWKGQRHELFSIPFIDALKDYDAEILGFIKLAVAGHHKDFEELQKRLQFYAAAGSFGMLDTPDEDETESYLTAFHKHVRVKDAEEIIKKFGVNINPVLATKVEGFIRKYNLNPYNLSHNSYLTLMLLFGGLKWCDHLGSAMITDLKMLTGKNFFFLQKQRADLQAKGFDFYTHQKQCVEINGNLLLTAPTGSGKTESAFLWLQNQLTHKGQARAFYILPFTASINAMYKRLNSAIGEDKVGMLHGKLSDFLNNYFDDLQYDVRSKKESIANIRDKFRSIITPVKVVTPFQLLKHLFGLKGYEQGLFEMAGSYLIFDEIHAYSPEVFAQIKVLLQFATKYLQAKVIIMTATMPRFMRKELENCIQPFTSVTADSTLYNQFKRHRIVLKDGLLENALDEITVQLQEGKKVLVVCNTVKSAQNVYKQLKNFVDEDEALLLHGSFTGTDRSSKEKDLMTKENRLLIGTQAIEVSLDIDYDMIYTEPAPIDALIQRFGRVNRKREKGICNCFVFTDNNKSDKFIYNLKVIQKTIAVLQNVVIKNDGIIDESGLQTLIDNVYEAWDEDDKQKFDSQYQYLTDAINVLAPMFKNKHTEEDFYKQFDGIKILPQSQKEEYEQKLQNFDFISAESQKLQIRKGRFAQWRLSDNLKQDLSVFASKNKMLEQRYWITNKKYTAELGLIADEEEPWKTAEIL